MHSFLCSLMHRFFSVVGIGHRCSVSIHEIFWGNHLISLSDISLFVRKRALFSLMNMRLRGCVWIHCIHLQSKEERVESTGGGPQLWIALFEANTNLSLKLLCKRVKNTHLIIVVVLICLCWFLLGFGYSK